VEANVNLLLKQENQPALIQIRRATATQWHTDNPILEVGEFGLDTDASFFKVGDGATRWDDLSFANEVVNSTSSTSTSAAASAAALKQVYDLLLTLTGGGGGEGGTSSAILSTVFTAKGDILASTGSNAPVRVAIGANGYMLAADSAAAAGVSWKPADDHLAYIFFN
jgi:hypothetical protein